MRNVNMAFSYDGKSFDNVNISGPQSNYKVGVASAGLSATEMDAWLGGGTSAASLTLTRGNVNLAGSANQQSDTDGARTAGGYQKLNLSLSRTQSLSATLSLHAAISAQTANKNLDSSEKIYLGGSGGVRAYPSSEGAGTQGRTLTLELRQKLNPQTTVSGVYDYGHATAFKDNQKADGSGLNSGVAPNNFAIKGYGVSASWQPMKELDLRATLARRIGESPLASPSTGMDADGTKKLNRVWVSASISF
jgi:hemolysin activation/secretion protein